MSYTTVSGDTWDGIAYKVYGNETFAGFLIDANTAYIETVIFSGGIILMVPELPKEDTMIGLPPWKQVQDE